MVAHVCTCSSTRPGAFKAGLYLLQGLKYPSQGPMKPSNQFKRDASRLGWGGPFRSLKGPGQDGGLRGYTIKVRPTRIYQSGPSGPLKDQAEMGDTWLVLGGKQVELQALPAHKGER